MGGGKPVQSMYSDGNTVQSMYKGWEEGVLDVIE